MRKILLVLSLLVLAVPAARSQTATLRYNPPASATGCGAAQNCVVSLTSPTNTPIIAGDTLIYQCEANHGAIYTVSNAGKFVPMKPFASIHGGYQGSQGVVLSAAAETGSDTITFTYQNGNASASTGHCTIWEYQVTGGTPLLDGDNGITSPSGTTIQLPGFTPSAAGDFDVLQSFAPFTAATSVSAPFSLFTNGPSALGHAEGTSASLLSPIFTWGSSQADLMAQSIELGFNSVPCTDLTLANFGGTNGGGGVNGTSVTAAMLAANTKGFQGGAWSFNGTGAFQYSTGAAAPLVGSLGRACDGTFPSVNGTTGITYSTSIGNNQNWEYGASTNGGILTTGSMTADINISFTFPNTDISYDDSFVSETQGDNDFLNAKLRNDTGTQREVSLECPGNGSADTGYTNLNPGQTYHFQEILNPGGTHYFNIYSGWQSPSSPGQLIRVAPCPSLGATYYPQLVAFGNGQVQNQPTPGYNVNFDSFMLTFGFNSTCYAASPAETDVAAAIALCKPISNSIVEMPTGLATWSTQILAALTSSMTLQGQSLCTGGCAPGSQGIGLAFADNGGVCTATLGTCITLNDVGQAALDFSGCTTANVLRITQITFIVAAANSGGSVQPNCTNGQSSAYRFDHLHVINNSNHGVFMEADGGTGLNDHILYSATTGYSYSVFGGDFSTVGYSNWAAPSPWGSANANFIEDSNSTVTTSNGALTDGHFGCNVVIRYSQITGWDGAGITHGTDSGGYRSCIIAEIYNNTMNTNATGANVNPWGSRGGSVIFHDNVLGGPFQWGAIALDYFRANPADAVNSQTWGLAGPGLNWTQVALNVGGTTLNAPAYQTNHTYAANSVVTLAGPCGTNPSPSNVQTTAGGTTGGSAPVCPQFPNTVTDSGGVVWVNVGGATSASPGGQSCGPSSNQQCAGFQTANPDTQCFSGATCLRYFDANGGVWPFRDQPGVVHNQVSVGNWQWNNSGPQQPANYWSTDSPGAVQLNRDYFNSAPSGYAAFGYPHPLNSTSSGSVSVSPSSESCGTSNIGSPVTCGTVTVTNNSGASITISSVTYGGTNGADFTNLTSPTCTGAIANGATCNVVPKFTPSISGTESGTVSIAYTGFSGTPNPLVVSLSGTGSAVAQLVTLSANKKFLVNGTTGQPVFLTGDAPQLLTLQLCANSDITQYLTDRASRNFNAMWVIAIDQLDQNNEPQDGCGNLPFTSGGLTPNNWFGTFNPTYWSRIDAAVAQMSSLGMTVFLQPSFIGNNDGNVYDTPQWNSAANQSIITSYCTTFATRYANANNIVYVLGGDYNPSNATILANVNACGAAMKAADPNHLITIEGYGASGGSNLSTSPYTSGTLPSWLTLNWGYDHIAFGNSISVCNSAFTGGLGVVPVQGEDTYEDEGGITSVQNRNTAYWQVLSGCFAGRLFGNGQIWSFNATHSGDPNPPTWQTELSSVGSVSQQLLGQLMRSREHWLMAPDISHTYLTAGFGSGNSTSVAARSSDGQTIIVYDPVGNTQAFTVNMAGITSASSTVKEWWYNPSNGVSSPIGTHANSGSVVFTAPDANDWVLVLDDASANLSAPGGGSVTISPSSENFGSVTVGHPSSGMASIVTNSTAAAITISTINYTGTNALDFSTSATTCSGSLAANGGSCTITTTFTPSILGVETATLNFAFTGASGSPIVVSVFGTGGSPGVGSCVETQTTTPSVGINVGRRVAETENNSTNDATQAIKPGGVCHAIQ